MREAVASYYRSQFLNSTLPGGVLGDVHRAVHHGREAGDLPRGARAVVWDRVSGQLVQVVLTVLVLLALPSPVRSSVPVVAALVVGGLVVVVLGCRALLRHGAARWSRMVRTAASDLRTGLLARRAWPVILVASSLAVFGHVAHLPGRGAHRRLDHLARSSWCRWRCSCWSRWASRPTWPAGVRARAWRPGRSRRPGSVPRRGSPPPWSTACWSSWPACPAPSYCCWGCGGDRPCVNVPTPCSAAASRSTATSTAAPTSG